MLLSLTAKLLHVVMLKRPLNLFMVENNSESVDVDPPLQHRDTWNGYLFARARCCWTWTLECLKLKRRCIFFSGYAFGYGPKTTGAIYGPSVAEVVRILVAGQKNLRKQTAKNNTYKSKIRIPTLYCVVLSRLSNRPCIARSHIIEAIIAHCMLKSHLFYSWLRIIQKTLMSTPHSNTRTSPAERRWTRLVRLLAAGQKNMVTKRAKNNTYRSKIKIPTLCCWCKVDSCLHCKFCNGAWRPRAAFQDSVLPFEDRIIYIDI